MLCVKPQLVREYNVTLLVHDDNYFMQNMVNKKATRREWPLKKQLATGLQEHTMQPIFPLVVG